MERPGDLQDAEVALAACGLPQAWAGRPQWRILATSFGRGHGFLAAWQAWRQDPQRPRLLHFVAIASHPPDPAQIQQTAGPHAQLAAELAAQWWGLLPGLHRLAFDDERVILTLCVGELQPMLRELAFRADSVFLGAAVPGGDLPTLKAIARLCRRGAGIATGNPSAALLHDMQTCGFSVPVDQPGRGRYDPSWDVKGGVADTETSAGRCAVIGAGLAGAAVTASLARRGWQVQVLDAAAAPAQGASGLPAGLLAPHQSPDDNMLSRLSRAGVRTTLRAAQALLPAEAWARTGVLQHRAPAARAFPLLGAAQWPWVRDADAGEKRAAGLGAAEVAWWHEQAAWVRPADLVRAWLQHPSIERRMLARVAGLRRDGTGWLLLGEADQVLAQADLVVVAAALGSAALLPQLALHAVRGQVSWSHEVPPTAAFPVNGNGHFLPCVSLPAGPAWLTGSTYGRGDTLRDERTEDHAQNLERLAGLLPSASAALEPQFRGGRVQGWSGVRCASTDRRPLAGLLEAGLGVSVAMGSRGLTFAALCAELLAAQLHGEPLPLERRLADALDVRRALPEAAS